MCTVAGGLAAIAWGGALAGSFGSGLVAPGFRIDQTGEYAFADLIFPPHPGGVRDSVGTLYENSDIEEMTAVVLDVLAEHISIGEAKHIARILPREIAELWPAS